MYHIGETIKRIRESIGITQESLCDGICTVEHLSRIENGKSEPTRTTFQSLMERMGKSGEKYLPFVHSTHVEYLNEWEKIEIKHLKRQYAEVDTMLENFEKHVDMEDNVNRQNIMRMRALNNYYWGKINESDKRKQLFSALSCTLPNYQKDLLFSSHTFLSRCEVRILCNIATSYAEEGELEKSIKLFQKLKNYFSNINIDQTERNINEIMIIANLSQTLGRNGNTADALDMGEQGINMCKITGDAALLAHFLYNVAFEMEILHLNAESCKEKLLQAYYVAELIENKDQMKHIAEHWKKIYEEDIPV